MNLSIARTTFATTLICLGGLIANAKADGDIFAFKYTKPLNYEMTSSNLVSSSTTGATASTAPNVTTTTTISHSGFILTQQSQTNLLSTVHYHPTVSTAQTRSESANGNSVISINGMQVKVLQNGVEVINSEKEIGMAAVKTVRLNSLPSLLSGDLTLDAQGHVSDIKGDLPFEDFWQSLLKNQVGLFGVYFPSHGIAVGESWNEVVTLKAVGEIKLDSMTISKTNTYTRLPDVTENDKKISVFSVQNSTEGKAIPALMDQGAQTLRCVISDFESHGNGTYYFSMADGVITHYSVTNRVHTEISASAQNRSMNARTDVDLQFDVKLMP